MSCILEKNVLADYTMWQATYNFVLGKWNTECSSILDAKLQNLHLSLIYSRVNRFVHPLKLYTDSENKSDPNNRHNLPVALIAHTHM